MISVKLLLLVTIGVHQLVHGLACVHYGRHVREFGFTFLHGIVPTFYVDVTDIFMASRRARLVTAVSGTLVHLVLGSAWFVLAVYLPPGFWQAFAAASGIIQWQTFVISLYPFCFIEMDGYHVLVDMLGEPTLKSRGPGLCGIDLPRTRRGGRLGRQQALYLAYVGLSAALGRRLHRLQRQADPARHLVVAGSSAPPSGVGTPRQAVAPLGLRAIGGLDGPLATVRAAAGTQRSDGAGDGSGDLGVGPGDVRLEGRPCVALGSAARRAWARARRMSPTRWASSATTARAAPARSSSEAAACRRARPDAGRRRFDTRSRVPVEGDEIPRNRSPTRASVPPLPP